MAPDPQSSGFINPPTRRSQRLCHCLWAVLVLQSLGLLFFTYGFFLIRLELHDISPQTPPPIPITFNSTLPPFSSPFTSSSLSTVPTTHPSASNPWPRVYDRVIFVVVDALRFDFLFFNQSLQSSPGVFPQYANKLLAVRDALQRSSDRSRLYRFEADAPTVTMQRLKGLLTGSLPTFFDAKDNFESSELHEDNWLTQAIHKGRRVHFVGDDTWARLIPILAGCQVNTLSRNMTDSHKSEACSRIVSHPLPSFEVHDLHTVDRGCMKHVPRSLCGQYGDWDILIAHLLGVDHVGHRHGPSSQAMSDKLTEINRFVQQLTDYVDLVAASSYQHHDLPTQSSPSTTQGWYATHCPKEGENPVETLGTQAGRKLKSTLLLVLGDHGMTADGNHGGASDAESGAGLFIYSSLPFASDIDRNVSSHAPSVGGDDNAQLFDTIPQIDLVPTLSLLLGLPIPFANLGTVEPSLLSAYQQLPSSSTYTKTCELCSHISTLALQVSSAHANAVQFQIYVEKYTSRVANFPSSFLTSLRSTLVEQHTRIVAFDTIVNKAYSLCSHCASDNNKNASKEDTALHQRDVLELVSKLRDNQIALNPILSDIKNGQVLTSKDALVYLIDPLHQLHAVFLKAHHEMMRTSVATFRNAWTQFNPYAMVLGLFVLICSFVPLSLAIGPSPFCPPPPTTLISLFPILILIGYVHGLFSNSYIVAEHLEVTFLTTTIAVIITLTHYLIARQSHSNVITTIQQSAQPSLSEHPANHFPYLSSALCYMLALPVLTWSMTLPREFAIIRLNSITANQITPSASIFGILNEYLSALVIPSLWFEALVPGGRPAVNPGIHPLASIFNCDITLDACLGPLQPSTTSSLPVSCFEALVTVPLSLGLIVVISLLLLDRSPSSDPTASSSPSSFSFSSPSPSPSSPSSSFITHCLCLHISPRHWDRYASFLIILSPILLMAHWYPVTMSSILSSLPFFPSLLSLPVLPVLAARLIFVLFSPWIVLSMIMVALLSFSTWCRLPLGSFSLLGLPSASAIIVAATPFLLLLFGPRSAYVFCVFLLILLFLLQPYCSSHPPKHMLIYPCPSGTPASSSSLPLPYLDRHTSDDSSHGSLRRRTHHIDTEENGTHQSHTPSLSSPLTKSDHPSLSPLANIKSPSFNLILRCLPIYETLLLFFLSLHLYACLGHGYSFADIHVTTAFVLGNSFHMFLAPLFVLTDTLCAHFLGVLGLLILPDRLPLNIPSPPSPLLSPRFLRVTLYLLISTLRLICTTVNVTLNRRHLMVWDIFAPKFVFDVLASSVALLSFALWSTITTMLYSSE